MSTREKYCSYHIFYFPFKWRVTDSEASNFSEQVSLERIRIKSNADWKRVTEVSGEDAVNLYNEKNYYYPFVHKALYDTNREDTLLMHFEHQNLQTRDVRYCIKVKGRDLPYELKVEAVNLNLYGTGVGFLSFYLGNDDKEHQSAPSDILKINQFGRRIMPPFFADIINRIETAEYIELKGLGENMREDFQYRLGDAWRPASFIKTLIHGVVENIEFSPVIDDRMFVATWYINDGQCNRFNGNLERYFREGENAGNSKGIEEPDFWYRFLFIDNQDSTCQNDEMKFELLRKHTYPRWEKWNSLYGACRYSLVYLTNSGAPDYLFSTFENIYGRMVELVLMQRASMLLFSEEVTNVSYLSHKEVVTLSERIGVLYKEYIHFVNQIYFREVTAQEQGIELYNMLQNFLHLQEYIADLDNEIGELHQYISLIEDRERNKKATTLNDLAAIFLPVSVITGFWGMNKMSDVIDAPNFSWQLGSLFIGVLCIMYFVINKKRKL